RGSRCRACRGARWSAGSSLVSSSGTGLLRAFGVALDGGEKIPPPLSTHHDEVVAGATVTRRVAGRQGVPPAVGDADAGAIAGRLEAHADPRHLVRRGVWQGPWEGEAAGRGPHFDPPPPPR